MAARTISSTTVRRSATDGCVGRLVGRSPEAACTDCSRAFARTSSPSILEEQIAAACLIADAADYIAETDPPLFGGGSGPGRQPLPEFLLDDERDLRETHAVRDTTSSRPSPTTLDDDIQFSVFRPTEIRPEKWYPLLAFGHRTTLIEEIDGTVVDPVDVVNRQAHALLQGEDVPFGLVRGDSTIAFARGSDLLFEAWLDDAEVNPPSALLRWEEPVHRVEFRIRAPRTADGRRLAGGMRVFLGVLLVGEVTFHVTVSSASPPPTRPSDRLPVQRFRQIFASYSHEDADVVDAIMRSVRSTGDSYLIDVQSLRSGERFQPRLAELIDSADIFQLFWSRNSMQSSFVREEWEHALGLGRDGFVRPVYWESPFPTDRERDLPPHALLELHFSRLAATPAVTAQVTATTSGRIMCKHCGQRNPDVAAFCERCGSALEWTGEKVSPRSSESATAKAATASAK